MFELQWTDEAKKTYELLKQNPRDIARYRAVKKTIQLLAANPKHPSLQTHKFVSLKGPNGEEVFEAYAQQRTSAAYRVFWCYGPLRKQMTIIAITPHP